MKKTISVIAAAAMMTAAITPVIAADNNPTVFVNNAEIFFEDQKAEIVDSRTLVPARGVFEAMGADVNWDSEARKVSIETSDHMTVIELIIDDNNMKVYDMSNMFATLLSGQDFNAPETVVELDVAPQILNDRTMIPLRAISEAMDATVVWNGDAYSVEITTKNSAPADETATGLTLSAESLTAAAGEEVVLYVNAQNIPEGNIVSGIGVTVKYDADNYEFVSAAMMNGDEEITSGLGANNPEFRDGYVKAAFVVIGNENAAAADGKVMKLTFKAITGEKGEFSLSNGYETKVGYNTALLLAPAEEGSKSVTYEGDTLYIDATPVVVNGEDAPEATAEPSESPAPEATADPEATAAPEATAEPSESPAPEVSPEPTETPAA